MWLKLEQQQWKCRKQAESGYTLKVEPTGFADQSDRKWKREGSQGRHQVLHPSCWKDRAAIEFEKL